ncbi:MAG TPA: hypothetical protein VIG33_17855 [Pseudobdellovibrionaceae bacterium]
MLGFPIQCKKLLDGKIILSTEHLEEFWNYAQSLSQLSPLADTEVGLISVEDSLCGAAAVFLCLFRDWLKNFPDREKWCFDQILNTVAKPPPFMNFEVEGDIRDHKWYHFCAIGAVVAWSENPKEKRWKEAIAYLCTSLHYKTVEILFSQSFKRREMLGGEWLRLQHLVFRWAEKRFFISLVRNYPQGYGETSETFKTKLAGWRSGEITGFASNAIDSTLPPLSSFTFVNDQITALGKKELTERAQKWPRFDLDLVAHAFQWMPDLNDAHNNNERKSWIAFWQNSLDQTIQVLQNAEQDDDVRGVQSKWDQWVFRGVVRLLTNLEPNENPDNFWKPILSLGPAYYYWIQDFFREFFFCNLGKAEIPKNFVQNWKNIFEFCLSSLQWVYDKKRHSHDLQDLWNSMASLPSMISELWIDKPLGILEEFKPFFERWLNHNFHRTKCAISMLEFLARYPELTIAFFVLVLVDEKYLAYDDHTWKKSEFGDAVAAFLEQLFLQRFDEVKSNAPALAAFQRVLKRLADTHNTIALEILAKMS